MLVVVWDLGRRQCLIQRITRLTLSRDTKKSLTRMKMKRGEEGGEENDRTENNMTLKERISEDIADTEHL